MLCEIELLLKFNEYNGFMKLEIKYNDTVMLIEPETERRVIIQVELPIVINFIVSDKDMDIDTAIDSNGNIICDKHIHLTEIVIDHYKVPSRILDEIVLLGTHNKSTGSYFGINGIATINFTENNAFKQYIVYENSTR